MVRLLRVHRSVTARPLVVARQDGRWLLGWRCRAAGAGVPHAYTCVEVQTDRRGVTRGERLCGMRILHNGRWRGTLPSLRVLQGDSQLRAKRDRP